MHAIHPDFLLHFVAPAPVVVHPVEQFLQGGWGTVVVPPKLYKPMLHVVQFVPPRPGAQTCTLVHMDGKWPRGVEATCVGGGDTRCAW